MTNHTSKQLTDIQLKKRQRLLEQLQAVVETYTLQIIEIDEESYDDAQDAVKRGLWGATQVHTKLANRKVTRRYD